MNRDYAKLGFIAHYTGLHVDEVEKVLQYALKYQDMQENKKPVEPQGAPLSIEEIAKGLNKQMNKERRATGLKV